MLDELNSEYPWETIAFKEAFKSKIYARRRVTCLIERF